jgi:hypothetical protein
VILDGTSEMLCASEDLPCPIFSLPFIVIVDADPFNVQERESHTIFGIIDSTHRPADYSGE